MPIDFLRNFYRRGYGMEREAAVKLMRALVDARFIADELASRCCHRGGRP